MFLSYNKFEAFYITDKMFFQKKNKHILGKHNFITQKKK